MARKLAAGNWKMNGSGAELDQVQALVEPVASASCEVLICPPATLIDRMRALVESTPLALGGQDCHAAASGAHTGDISAGMLADAGASHVIVGHSERRTDHGESDHLVATKAEAGRAAGLTPVICLGETLSQREAGQTLAVVTSQLSGSVPESLKGEDFVIAYEPVWAIGTGLTPTLEQIEEVHGALRTALADRLGPEAAQAVRLLYGGSVKPGNAAEIFGVPDVDGALVGGASLKAADFAAIIAALDAA